MRELTIQIRFLTPCLGHVKCARGFMLPRDCRGRVMFMATWYRDNMLYAAGLLGKHQTEVRAIQWDIAVDGCVTKRWHERHYRSGSNGKWRYAQHQAFHAGAVVSLNCAVPSDIPDEDVWRLMEIAGTYRGLSPYKPEEGYGRFEVVSVYRRRYRAEVETEETR